MLIDEQEAYVRAIEPQRVGSALRMLYQLTIARFLQEKLSEEALSEKLASMKLRNAQLTAQREVRHSLIRSALTDS